MEKKRRRPGPDGALLGYGPKDRAAEVGLGISSSLAFVSTTCWKDPQKRVVRQGMRSPMIVHFGGRAPRAWPLKLRRRRRRHNSSAEEEEGERQACQDAYT